MYIKLEQEIKIMLCPICEEGSLTKMSYPAPQEVDGEETMVPVEYSVCDHCESEQADAEQSKKNKEAMKKAQEGKVSKK